MATSAIYQHAKSFRTLRWIFLRYFMKFDERNKIKSLLFYFHGNCAKFVLPIPIFLGLSRSTRCGCDRKHYCKNLWSFCTLVTMATAAILNLFNPQKLPHTTVDIPTKFHKIWWKESKCFFIPPFLFPWQLRQCLSNRFRFLWLISFHKMWMLFLSSFINFCSASNLLWSFLCFSIF